MQLIIADHNDAMQISRQVYDIWSAGLKKAEHRQLFWTAFYQTWAKHNTRRMIYKIGKEIVFSCKTTRLNLVKNRNHYQILGLGAIFTVPNWRKQGLAGSLMKYLIQQAKKRNIDGLFLFSAIDRTFYESLGFAGLGSLDFEISPQNYAIKDSLFEKKIATAPNNELSIEIRSAEYLCSRDRLDSSSGHQAKFHFDSFDPWISEDDLMEMLRCHERWVSRQPYGLSRDRHYFSYQLARFLYFATYSANNKANWFLTIVKDKLKRIIGYAFTECSGTNMRIIELIGDDLGRSLVWQSLIGQANKLKLSKISGFESVVRDFVPCSRLDPSLLSIEPPIRASAIKCHERFWSQPMFLPLNSDLKDLFDTYPCPLLEFDYI